MTDSLAKVGLEKLAKDKLKRMHKAEIARVAKQKSTNRVVQKDGVIIERKT